MAITHHRARARQQRLTRLTIGITILAALIAVAPIIGAAIGLGSRTVGPSTAFASAPAGNYAIVTRNEGLVDVVSVVWAENPSAVTEIVRVPHLDGFTSTGSVSPDGKRVALVTVDAGSPTRPGASLLVANLETGELIRIAIDVEPLQTPVWAPDSRHVIATRLAAEAQIDVMRVALNANESVLSSHRGALGVYPVGFDGQGRLLQVLIDGRGSTLQRDGADLSHLSSNITRDWQLSPGGSQVGFIDVRTSGGLEFMARLVPVDQPAGMQVQGLEAPSSALGVAWNPASKSAQFGLEPQGATAGVQVQGLAAGTVAQGFDIPLAYSGDGAVLAGTHWGGTGFGQPGSPALPLVYGSVRVSLAGFTGFLGWSQR